MNAAMSRQQRWALAAAGLLAFLGLWTGMSLSGLVNPQFLPPPWAVLARMAHLAVEPFVGFTLGAHLLSSFGRFAYAFVLAAAVGIPLGLCMAWWRPLDRLLTPLFDLVRFIAPIAWVPFAALWFGTGIGGPVLVIFMGAFPPVLINTYRGARYVETRFIEAAQMLGASNWRMLTQVLLPAALPSIVAGLRISAGLGWQSLVGSELIVASSGIGYLMVKGQSSIQTDVVMSAMVAIGVVGFALDALLRMAQARLDRAAASKGQA